MKEYPPEQEGEVIMSRLRLDSTLIVRLTAIGLVVIGIAAFVLSYNAVYVLALSNNVPDNLAWLFPLLGDAVIIVAALSVIGQHLEGEGTRYQWALVGIFTVLSIALNFLHAPADNWTARGLSIVPPIALFLTFELLSIQIQRSVKRNGVYDSLGELTIRHEQQEQVFARYEQDIAARMAKMNQDLADLGKEIRQKQAYIETLDAEVKTLRKERRTLNKGLSDNAADVSETSETTQDKAASNGAAVQVKLSAVQRQAAILRDIQGANGQGAPSVEDMASKYSVSVKTIQRDIAALDLDKEKASN